MKRRKEVELFADAMERKLQKNDYKGGWKGMYKEEDFEFLRDKFNEELTEFLTAFKNRSNRMLNEGADVANIIMMICDVAEKLTHRR